MKETINKNTLHVVCISFPGDQADPSSGEKMPLFFDRLHEAIPHDDNDNSDDGNLIIYWSWRGKGSGWRKGTWEIFDTIMTLFLLSLFFDVFTDCN